MLHGIIFCSTLEMKLVAVWRFPAPMTLCDAYRGASLGPFAIPFAPWYKITECWTCRIESQCGELGGFLPDALRLGVYIT